jgi:hypothetical protein
MISKSDNMAGNGPLKKIMPEVFLIIIMIIGALYAD